MDLNHTFFPGQNLLSCGVLSTLFLLRASHQTALCLLSHEDTYRFRDLDWQLPLFDCPRLPKLSSPNFTSSRPPPLFKLRRTTQKAGRALRKTQGPSDLSGEKYTTESRLWGTVRTEIFSTGTRYSTSALVHQGR